MEKSDEGMHVVRFAAFEANCTTGELRKHGIRVKLQDQPFQILAMLLARPGELVTREEIRRSLWPSGTFIDFDNGLNTAINRLREALGDSAENPKFIETLPRRGYRFIGALDSAAPARAQGVGSASAFPRAEESPGGARPRWRRKTALAAGGVALTALLALGIWFAVFRARGKAIESVAVLPFVNASADPNTEYLSDGITESLINNLSQLPNLRVMARSTMFRYKGKEADPEKVGQDLRVRAVLSGRLLQRGDTLIVQAELMDVATGSQLWGGQYNRRLPDLLAVQDQISQEISEKLRLRLTGEEKSRLASPRAANPDAYELYLQSRFYFNRRSPEAVKKALDYLNQAIARDPNYALAYAALADCYVILEDRRIIPSEEAYTKGMVAVQRSLALDPTLAEPHAAMAVLRAAHDFAWAGAEAEFKRAIELNPNYATAHQWYGQMLMDVGRLEEAHQQLELARGLDPLSLQVQRTLGDLYEYARQFDRSIAECSKIEDMDSGFAPAHFCLAKVYFLKGMYPEAAAERQKYLLGMDEREIAALYEGISEEVSYRRAVSREITLLKERAKNRYVSPMSVVDLYVQLGDKEQAMAWLEKAYQERASRLRYLKMDAVYDPLRADPRFQDLLRRIGLPQ
jgi:TolB-like protein/DNA-binding winged helix-turn-helix (wHTH) protein/Tfp pilus assembly protein PilF